MIVDKDLLLAAEQAQAGNERAFYYLYKRTYSDMYFRGMLLMENKEQTKELCRQVYLLVYRRIGKLENIQQLSSWMYQLLYTSAAKAWRSLPEYLIPEDKLDIVQTIEFYEKSERLEEQIREKVGKEIQRDCIDKLSNNQRVVWKEHIWQDLSIYEISEHHQCEEKRIERYLEQAWNEIGRIQTEEEFSQEEAKKLYGNVCEMINEGVYPSLGSVIEKKEIQSEFANTYASQNQPAWGSLKDEETENADDEGYEEYGDDEEEEEYEEGYDEEEEDGFDKEKLDRKKKQMVILFAASGIVVFIIIAILLIKNGFGGNGADDREYTRRETSQETKSKKKKESKKETTKDTSDSGEVHTTSQNIDTSETTTSKKPKETTSKETTSKETTSKEPDTSQETSQDTSKEPDTSDSTAPEPTDETSSETISEPDSTEPSGDSTQFNEP